MRRTNIAKRIAGITAGSTTMQRMLRLSAEFNKGIYSSYYFVFYILSLLTHNQV
jgi:hypothetical protein